MINSASGEWLLPADVDAPLVVLVHGFSSHGGSTTKLAAYCRGRGFVTAIFNYNSYEGIDAAAETLRDRLATNAAELAAHGYVLVGHSMGGLVALGFACAQPQPLLDTLKGIVLLGTPSAGTLQKRRMVSLTLKWADALT